MKTLKVRVWYLLNLDLFGALERRRGYAKEYAQPIVRATHPQAY